MYYYNKSTETRAPSPQPGKPLANVTFLKRRRRREPVTAPRVPHPTPTTHHPYRKSSEAEMRVVWSTGWLSVYTTVYAHSDFRFRTDTQLITAAAAPTGPSAVRRRSYFTGQLPVDRVKRRRHGRMQHAPFACTQLYTSRLYIFIRVVCPRAHSRRRVMRMDFQRYNGNTLIANHNHTATTPQHIVDTIIISAIPYYYIRFHLPIDVGPME